MKTHLALHSTLRCYTLVDTKDLTKRNIVGFFLGFLQTRQKLTPVC
jgi:hypothetical protein